MNVSVLGASTIALALASLVPGCGSTPSRDSARAAPPTPGPDSALASSGGEASGHDGRGDKEPDTCRYAVDELYMVRIALDDFEPFSLHVDKADMVMQPRAEWGDLDIEVKGALEFRGEVEIDHAHLYTSRERRAAGGTVVLIKDLSVEGIRQAPSGKVACTILMGESIKQQELSVEVGPVELDCDDIEVNLDRPPLDVSPSAVSGGSLQVAVSDSIVLYPDLRGDSGVVVRRLHDTGMIPFYMLDTQRSHSWVAWRWADGTELAGWVKSSQIREPIESEQATIDKALSPGDVFGWGTIGTGRLGTVGPPPGIYIGPGEIRAGTPVFAAPERSQWAVVAADFEFEVRWIRGEDWVQIERGPGFPDLQDKAWVHRNALTLPDPDGAAAK